MTIAKLPQGISKVQPQDEAAARQLVEGAPATEQRKPKPKSDKPKPPPLQRKPKARIMLQIDLDILARIDAEVVDSGISRSAWLVLAAKQKLDGGE